MTLPSARTPTPSRAFREVLRRSKRGAGARLLPQRAISMTVTKVPLALVTSAHATDKPPDTKRY
jgi:hypothetical protein